MKVIRFIHRYLGWRNWAVLTYNSIAENIFILFYVALADRLSPFAFTVDLLAFLLFSMFSTTYGYLINDLADKDLDALHGKTNTFQNDSKGKAALIVGLFLVLSVASGVRFAERGLFLFLWAVWFFLATFYSLKPIRLKERGKIGLAFVVLAQRGIPALMALAAFGHQEAVVVLFFTTYILFRGLSSDINHQLEDYGEDSKTDTETYAVKSGFTRSQKMLRFSLIAERVLLAVCLGIMLFYTLERNIFGFPYMLPLVGAYALLCVAALAKARRHGVHKFINPFHQKEKDIFQFLHHGFPSVVLPFYLILILSFENGMFGFLLALFVLYRGLYSPRLILESFPAKMLRRGIAVFR